MQAIKHADIIGKRTLGLSRQCKWAIYKRFEAIFLQVSRRYEVTLVL